MVKRLEERFAEVPDGVDVKLEEKVVKVRGPLGELSRDFSHSQAELSLDGERIRVWVEWPRRKDAAVVGAVASHIRNMMVGVTKGFTYKMRMVYAHFPITVKVEGRKVLIENFSGGRRLRTARIQGDVEVSVGKEEVLLHGLSIEDVSQTAANIEQALKLKDKDPRVFLDGIYLYAKEEGM